jgi:selenocysteine-specific elongation factor
VDVRPEQEPLLESLERLYLDARFLTPDPDAAAKEVGADEGKVAGAIGLLCDRGTLVEVEPGIVFHTRAVEEAKKLAVAQIRKEGPMPTPVFRDLLGVSRRHAVPLLDHLDRIGVTFRVGNTRVLPPPRG